MISQHFLPDSQYTLYITYKLLRGSGINSFCCFTRSRTTYCISSSANCGPNSVLKNFRI